ncbi:phosphodiester glycosidase family protein, partial [Clostridiaceae bacterium HSG29]|nr:phosphodiester glycosidase family protein [Clostridiaceae bacterium HSG29]
SNNNDKYEELINEISSSINSVKKKSTFTLIAYDYLVNLKLGNSIYENYTSNYKLQIYNIENGTYKGYMAKIKLINPEYFKLKIANDTLGEKLPTSKIAKNNDAILAINGGGFFKTSLNDKPFTQTVGTTISSGNLISSTPVNEDGFFISGIDNNGHLIGEPLNYETNIEKTKINEGVSFVPILLKDSKKQLIPIFWRNRFHPRTIIGKFANEDLFLMVIDGRQPGYSNGITLETIQNKLLEFGIIDAYNLDGGGSSSFYYDTSLLNRPSDDYERPVPNAFILLR